jgi:DNA-binding response OmpR family regulator
MAESMELLDNPQGNTTIDDPDVSTRILMIDDDVKFCRMMRDYLSPLGIAVSSVHTGGAGLEAAHRNDYSGIILDVRLPGMDGLEVLRKLRATSNVPIMMLTAHGEEPDLIVGLELGADDYVAKTTSPRELLARIRALTRRQRPAVDVPIRVGNLQIDPSSRQSWLNEKPLPLSSFEFDLLLSLAKSAGSIRTRESLLREAAARTGGAMDRTIDVHISSLRKKMGDDVRDPEYIATIRNVGYMLKRQL